MVSSGGSALRNPGLARAPESCGLQHRRAPELEEAEEEGADRSMAVEEESVASTGPPRRQHVELVPSLRLVWRIVFHRPLLMT